MKQILIVDDEAGIRELLSEILIDEGFEVKLANNAEDARNARNVSKPDLVLLDIWMPDTDGITLLKEWGARGLLTMPVIMMSGHGTIDTAVEATKIGAHAFLEKPFPVRKLLSVVNSVLSKPFDVSTKSGLVLIGTSPSVKRLRSQIQKLKSSRLNVLISGEPGLQVHQLAREFKATSQSWTEVDASRIDMDSGKKMPVLQKEGVVYFRDIHELSKKNQKNLKCHLLELKSNGVRVISSSNRDLSTLMSVGDFDGDLYKLLATGVILATPSLRSRREDIPELANIILERESEIGDINVKGFTTAALNALRNYHWPGNIIQLESVVKTCVQLAAEDLVDIGDIKSLIESKNEKHQNNFVTQLPFDMGLRQAREMFERKYFEYHLANEKGSITKISALTGVDRTHLYRKLKNLGINVNKKQGR